MSKQNTISAAPSISTGMKAVVLFTMSLASFTTSFMAQGLNIALPRIGLQFGADAVLLNWMVMAFVLANAALSLPIGRISDILGPRHIFIGGVIFYTLSSFAASFSNSSLMLIICRAAQGAGASMILVNLIALISILIPARERGLALGISVSSVYIGASTGPFLGGLLTETFGWKSIFLLNVVFGVLIIWLMLWKVRDGGTGSRGQRMDYFGAVIYSLALVVLMYGFSLLPEITGVVLISASIIGMLVFLWWENRTASPLFNIGVFRHNRLFIFSNICAMANYAAVFAVAFLLSLYLQYIKGFSPVLAGLVMISHPVIQSIFSPLAGRLSDKMEPRLLSSLGMALTTLSLISFAFLSSGTPVVLIVLALVVLGAGFALFLSPNTNALMSSVDPRFYGVASATMSTMIAGGQTLSMGISMIVMANIIGRVVITPDYYPAYLTSARVAFAIFAVMCCAGVVVSLTRGKMRD
jgi:EmrB/QacA subfamily drug resistance transporter